MAGWHRKGSAIFAERYQQAGTPLATGVDFTEWQLEWVPEQEEIELGRQRAGKEYQPDVVEMGETPFLCCPQDHGCEKSCKADKTLCRMCEIPI